MKPRCSATAALQRGQPVGVAVEQVEHVLRGAHRALDPAQRVAGRSSSSRAYATSISSAAEANRLPRVVACAGTLWLRPASTSSACSAARRASRASTATERSRTCRSDSADLQLLDVLGEVAAGQALVHVLVPGERVELLDARLDVVPGDPLAGGDGVEVHLVDDRARSRRPRRPVRRPPGHAGPAARRATAGAPERSCSRVTTVGRARGSRSGRPGRWGSRG